MSHDQDGIARMRGSSRMPGCDMDDPQANFLQHFLPIQSALKGFLLAATRDQQVVDDLLQEVAVVLWQKFAEYDPERSFRAWALRVAGLEVQKRRQALARRRPMLSIEVLGDLAATAASMDDEEDRRLVHLTDCVGKLPQHAQTLVRMRFGSGCRLAEIAGTLGRNLAAVEMAMVRIRRGLRVCVEQAMAHERMDES